MDTPCVSVKPELDAFRKESILNMRNIHEQAGTVLVLDSAFIAFYAGKEMEWFIR